MFQIFQHVLLVGSLNQSQPHVGGIANGILQIVCNSPLASNEANTAVQAAWHNILLSRNDSVICGRVPFANGSLLPLAANSYCVDKTLNLGALIVPDPRVTVHPNFQDPMSCAPGTFYTYTFNPLLDLQCQPCAPNTFTDLHGSAMCSPCPSGLTSAPGSSSCTANAAQGSAVTIAVVVPVCVLTFLLGLVWVQEEM